MTGPRTLMTKGEYAARCGVSRQAVSYWLSEGKIPPAALAGEGQRAKIWVERADHYLKPNLTPRPKLEKAERRQPKEKRRMGKKRTATSADILAIAALLKEHLTEPVDGLVTYRNGHTDVSIANLVGGGLSAHSVARVRNENFGRLKVIATSRPVLPSAVLTFLNDLADHAGFACRLDYDAAAGTYRIRS